MWIAVSFILTLAQLLIGAYNIAWVIIGLIGLSSLKLSGLLLSGFRCLQIDKHERSRWQNLSAATSLEEWQLAAEELDSTNIHTRDWKHDTEDFPNAELLQQTLSTLRDLRERKQTRDLMVMLSGLVKRNHLGIDDWKMHSHCLAGTKDVIENFHDEMVRSLEAVANCSEIRQYEKLRFFRTARTSFGVTALNLSGGGSVAMYHSGVLRALCEAGLYENIRVFSGTSGGSIMAAMVGIKTQQELLDDVCVKDVATDFMHNGRQKEGGIRWFPPLLKQAVNFVKAGTVMETREFERTTKFYYGDITFQEAFERTGKHINITVTASQRGGSRSGPQRMLLNHINTPHVLICSAVTASCCLPGIMEPTTLLMKTSDGVVEDFAVDGVEWIDGSVMADVPFQRLAALFNVSNFVVSQANFHVQPFITKRRVAGPDRGGSRCTQFLFKIFDRDVRHRARKLSKLGLFPKFFGHDVSGVFKQKYHGDVTIVPPMSLSQSLGLVITRNPTEADMVNYITGGKMATWPHIAHITHLMRIETVIGACCRKARSAVLKRASEVQLLQTVFEVEYSNPRYRLASIASEENSDGEQVTNEVDSLKKQIRSLEIERGNLQEQVRCLQATIHHLVEDDGRDTS